MHFLSLSLPILCLGLFSPANAGVLSERPSTMTSLKDCPADMLSEVGKQVFTTLDGRSLTATTYSCAAVGNGGSTAFEPRALPLELAARQNPQICNQTCVQSCHEFGSNVPNCTDLIDIVNNLDGQTFLAPPGTITLFEAGQCSTRFFHNQAQPVDVCFSWLSGLLPTMNACFATPPQTAAECNQANVNFSFDLTLIFPGALN